MSELCNVCYCECLHICIIFIGEIQVKIHSRCCTLILKKTWKTQWFSGKVYSYRHHLFRWCLRFKEIYSWWTSEIMISLESVGLSHIESKNNLWLVTSPPPRPPFNLLHMQLFFIHWVQLFYSDIILLDKNCITIFKKYDLTSDVSMSGAFKLCFYWAKHLSPKKDVETTLDLKVQTRYQVHPSGVSGGRLKKRLDRRARSHLGMLHSSSS